MALTNLPSELLDMIVEYSLPEGFENLATTCKRIYGRCRLYIERHNELSSRFQDFGYYSHTRDTLVAASDLISLIATDASIARYLRIADLRVDSKYLPHLRVRNIPPKSVPSIEEGGAIVQLFANSVYLHRAGLDWREYYSTFAEDVKEMRYSQHGSAFLLTLLGHVEWLELPNAWKPNTATNELLNVIAKEARQTCLPSSGLRPLKKFLGSSTQSGTETWGLSWVSPFLVLPHITIFGTSKSFALGQHPRSIPFRDSPYTADTLEVAYLGACCIDDVGISAFLKHTPRLKALMYSHGTEGDYLPSDWDICKFITAVAREAGSHLIEFSVRMCDQHGSILPGRVSTRPFQKLKKFEIPQRLITCNIHTTDITANIAQSMSNSETLDPVVQDLIPPSVTHLRLDSDGMGPFDTGLDAFFRHFRAVRKFQLPNLQEVHIYCKHEAISAYKQQCNEIAAAAEREGVVVHVNAYYSYGDMDWETPPYNLRERR
ncbi:hypothetical protein SLS60_002551 [Paraconiothyrium brasiliense]|uniref:F-box domain-containing protein n=1 Tax=Paraconiothyrium brasiliense TaxID=300254 RepID=A0ABR3RUI9_9PLEO